jgi:hypothetical protein
MKTGSFRRRHYTNHQAIDLSDFWLRLNMREVSAKAAGFAEGVQSERYGMLRYLLGFWWQPSKMVASKRAIHIIS